MIPFCYAGLAQSCQHLGKNDRAIIILSDGPCLKKLYMFNSLTFLLNAPTLFPLSISLARARISPWLRCFCHMPIKSYIIYNPLPLWHFIWLPGLYIFNALSLDYLSYCKEFLKNDVLYFLLSKTLNHNVLLLSKYKLLKYSLLLILHLHFFWNK